MVIIFLYRVTVVTVMIVKRGYVYVVMIVKGGLCICKYIIFDHNRSIEVKNIIKPVLILQFYVYQKASFKNFIIWKIVAISDRAC